MADDGSLVTELQEGRRRFLALVADLRPDLHRYCARMTGSVVDGEDIVQETLARAYYALSEMEALPPLRPWLFQIAHNRALDHLRRYDRRMGRQLEEASEVDPEAVLPDDALAQAQATRAALSRFMDLATLQRSCVILKDVLGHPVDEIVALLAVSEPAVKAALHRGRERLRTLSASGPPEPPRAASPGVARYAALFNAHDWDGVRSMLAEDVRLDLISRAQRSGRGVASYFSNYERVEGWRMAPAWLEGREVVAVFHKPGDERPGYFVCLQTDGDKITLIRDFRYAPYILDDAALALSPG